MFATLFIAAVLAQSPLDAGEPDAGEVDAGELISDAGNDALSLSPTLSPAGEGAPRIALGDGREAPADPPVADAGTPGTTLGKLPKGFTGLVGRITDSRTGEGLIEATIKVTAGGKKSALTDLEGSYRMKLPPGNYEVRVFYELYQGRKIANLEVKKGEALTLDVALEADKRAVQEVVVEAKADKRNETALVQERKKAVVAQDSLSAAVIARTPDSNAGDAVKRVVGATLVDGRYVYIRGLGGRYTQTLLNSTLMPSPEPDDPSVPLDLFPVALLSNLNVIKTYSVELPANFAGGSVTIDTNTFPNTFELALRAQVSGDTMTTGQLRPNESTSAGEAIGFSSGTRGLPAAIPTDVPVTPTRIGSPGVTADQQRAAAGAFSQKWTPSFMTGLPSGTFGATVGDTFHLGKEVKLGYLVSGQVARRERRQHIDLVIPTLNSGESSFVTEMGSVSGATSGLVNVGLSAGRNHEVSYLGLFLTNVESTATTTAGYDQSEPGNIQASRLGFTQRQLFFNQLKGFHRFHALNDAEIDWQANVSRVNRNEPDIRDTRYVVDENGARHLRVGQPNSLERYFLDLHEDSYGGTLSLTVPWRAWRFKVGGLGQFNDRTFDGRRFRYFGRLSGEQEQTTPEILLVDANFGPPTSAASPITLQETTQATDRYTSSLLVGAGYASIDWKPTGWLRANAGFRLEGSRLTITGGSPFATGVSAPIEPVVRNYLDAVPAVNVVLSPRTDLNVRLAYSYTLARPSFRELAPFSFFDTVRRRNVSGKPDLINSRIHNADARVEWFLGASDLLALTAFGKQFENPIERVVIGTGSVAGDLGFRNNAGATLLGLELEARVGLGRFTQALKTFSAGANFSLIYSRIQLDPGLAQTNAVRPLQGQSPYIGNAFIQWAHPTWGTDIGVFYNVYGPRILDVGINGLQDVIEQPFHRLDVTVSQPLSHGLQLKVSAANVLNQTVRLKQGSTEVLTNPPGVQFFATLSWNFDKERLK